MDRDRIDDLMTALNAAQRQRDEWKARAEAAESKLQQIKGLTAEWQKRLWVMGGSRTPGTRNARAFADQAMDEVDAVLDARP